MFAYEHMEYCIVQRCNVQCKSKRFGSAALTTDEGSTSETFRFTLNYTVLNYIVFHVFISINAVQGNYI